MTVTLALIIGGGLSACDDDKPIDMSNHPTALREGCSTPPPGHGPNIIADRTWEELTSQGLAWSVIILARVPRLSDGKKDLDSIHDRVQQALNDLNVQPHEKVFASETVPVISMQLDTNRARKMAALDYVCAITDDRAMWPLG